MILVNRKTLVDCPGCGGRYETKDTGEAFGTPCPECGHMPELWQGEAAEP